MIDSKCARVKRLVELSEPQTLADVAGRVAVVTLNRPARRNALNSALIAELGATMTELDSREDVDAIVLTGADPAFCAGVDITELEETGQVPSVSSPIPAVGKPLVGAINGPAITGGLELALMCDILIASERARFGDTHARLGLLPGWGQTARLAQAVGFRRAAELLLTSRVVDAEEALRMGLVQEVTPHHELLDRSVSLATDITKADQPAARAALELLRTGAGLPLTEALALERRAADDWQGAGIDRVALAERSAGTLAANRLDRPPA
jgi:enoyl-CoA hydratase/carnithine racemase